MPDIKITFQEVKDAASQIRTCNNTLDEKLQQIKSTIKDLESQWTSDTSDTIRAKIEGMQPVFKTYKEVIETYAKFLDTTVEEYTKTEASLNTNASAFK
ncbi:MAG TPA: WXG100 family type VII secretion target [Candidatus Caccousia avistercoris]|nr:WXG100 family type VII secretion target [Candidatus Caccousia avistercoris]